MGRMLFGPAGIPFSAKKPSCEEGIRRCKEMGLGCMEIEFVQRVTMGEATARKVAVVAQAEGIALTSHAPYYVNLTSFEEEKQTASVKRVLQAARITSYCSGTGAVFHAAFYQGEPRAAVYDKVKAHLQSMVQTLREEGISGFWLRPETTGKDSQFGTVEELLRLSQEVDGVLPCIDFSHLHARSAGAFNTYGEFMGVLNQVEEALGPAGLQNMHCHLSGIEYTAKGERKHLPLEESDMNYTDVLRALKDKGASGTLACESPNLEVDAMLLQETYARL